MKDENKYNAIKKQVELLRECIRVNMPDGNEKESSNGLLNVIMVHVDVAFDESRSCDTCHWAWCCNDCLYDNNMEKDCINYTNSNDWTYNGN